MADSLMGVTTTVATALDAISAQVQIYLQEEAVMIPNVMNFSALAVKGSKQVEIPRAPGFSSVDDKAENAAVDAQTIVFSTDVLNLNKHKVIQWIIEKIASEQSVVAVLNEAILRAGQDIANQVDKDIIAILENVASSPDHSFVYTGGGGTEITEADILKARRLLRQQKLSASMMKSLALAISPEQEEIMLKIANFIDASKYGVGAPIATGEIGRVFGVRVFVHNDINNLKSLMFHPSAAGYATQIGPDFDSQKDLRNLGTRYSIDQLYGTKELDTGKRAVLIGTDNP